MARRYFDNRPGTVPFLKNVLWMISRKVSHSGPGKGPILPLDLTSLLTDRRVRYVRSYHK